MGSKKQEGEATFPLGVHQLPFFTAVYLEIHYNLSDLTS